MSIHSPKVVAKARELGITELQAIRHIKQQEAVRRYARNPALLLQLPAVIER